jgi:hypothetical protein
MSEFPGKKKICDRLAPFGYDLHINSVENRNGIGLKDKTWILTMAEIVEIDEWINKLANNGEYVFVHVVVKS